MKEKMSRLIMKLECHKKAILIIISFIFLSSITAITIIILYNTNHNGVIEQPKAPEPEKLIKSSDELLIDKSTTKGKEIKQSAIDTIEQNIDKDLEIDTSDISEQIEVITTN